MSMWVIKNGVRQHMESGEHLLIDGKVVCKNPSMYMRYLFEKEMLELEADVTREG